jgi:indolepyruvate ferredoxin oxidoreductase alpha subunit
LVEAIKLSIASNAPGKSIFLLGNEAIARGAIESGVQFVASYPGTPSSEITEALINVSKELNFYAEWSVNEKVAFESALGASMCGVRSLAIMKHVGVNVAQDPILSAAYMKVAAGLVLISADDPGQWSSQNEQDNRFIAEMGYIPVLEPSSPQEAKDMMADAFNLSERFGQLFMLRTVTRLSHARGDVKLGAMSKDKKEGFFKKNTAFICLPAFSRKNRVLIIERFNKIKDEVDNLPYNNLKLVDGARLGIIACGISNSYTKEALNWLEMENKVSLLKIGTPHPLPHKLVRQLLASVPQVLVVEELEPFVENHVKVIAQDAGIAVKIHGKDVVPLRMELSTRKVMEAITSVTGSKLPVDFTRMDKIATETAPLLPFRPPTLCAGCPHRATYYAINVVARKTKKDLGDRICTGDIGCYSLGANAPLCSDDTEICMGAGFGVANGIAHIVKNPVIGHMGDSTFFHSGIPPLINAVFNKAKITMVVMDNSATAMTGFQPHPGTGSSATGEASPRLRPEEIARACGVNFVEVVDPFDVKRTIEVIEKAVRYDGPAVVVARRLCSILEQRDSRKRGEKMPSYKVNQDTCSDCQLCIKSLGCPAILIENGKVAIDTAQCVGCALCAQICPTGAILMEESK